MTLEEVILELEDFELIQESSLEGQLILDIQSYTFLPTNPKIEEVEAAVARVENMFIKKIRKIKSLLGDIER